MGLLPRRRAARLGHRPRHPRHAPPRGRPAGPPRARARPQHRAHLGPRARARGRRAGLRRARGHLRLRRRRPPAGATGPLGTRSYRWNDAGQVAAVLDADGVVEVENTYDTQRRVTAQRSPFGRTTRYAYLPGRATVVSDADGTRSNTWIHDEQGRLVGVVDADEHRQSMSYDARGNVVLVTERDGATTVHEYDDRGRRTHTVTPSGADLTYGYDEHDRLTTVVAEAGAITEYVYPEDDEAARQPAVIIDPEGGPRCSTWRDGLLTKVVDPVGVEVTFTHDGHGDLVATTDAAGGSARLERDRVGRVVAAVTPQAPAPPTHTTRPRACWPAVATPTAPPGATSTPPPAGWPPRSTPPVPAPRSSAASTARRPARSTRWPRGHPPPRRPRQPRRRRAARRRDLALHPRRAVPADRHHRPTFGYKVGEGFVAVARLTT